MNRFTLRKGYSAPESRMPASVWSPAARSASRVPTLRQTCGSKYQKPATAAAGAMMSVAVVTHTTAVE